MSDIRNANPFIEAGFELLRPLKMPRRKPARDLGPPNNFTLDDVYYGRWYRDGFNTSGDDCFYLVTFEPDFRSYYAIGGLYSVCAGSGDCWFAGNVSDYLREAIWHDFKFLGNESFEVALRCVLNGLSLVEPELLDEAQRVLIEGLKGEENIPRTFISYPVENDLRFSFEELKQLPLNTPICQENHGW